MKKSDSNKASSKKNLAIKPEPLSNKSSKRDLRPNAEDEFEEMENLHDEQLRMEQKN